MGTIYSVECTCGFKDDISIGAGRFPTEKQIEEWDKEQNKEIFIYWAYSVKQNQFTKRRLKKPTENPHYRTAHEMNAWLTKSYPLRCPKCKKQSMLVELIILFD